MKHFCCIDVICKRQVAPSGERELKLKLKRFRHICRWSLPYGSVDYEKNSRSLFSCSVRLSKNFSFWTASLILCATFKIKSLQYKDLILNSTDCRKSNRLLRQPLFCIFFEIYLTAGYTWVILKSKTVRLQQYTASDIHNKNILFGKKGRSYENNRGYCIR